MTLRELANWALDLPHLGTFVWYCFLTYCTLWVLVGLALLWIKWADRRWQDRMAPRVSTMRGPFKGEAWSNYVNRNKP